MVNLQDMIKISEYEWEIPQSYRQDMRVPVRIFATRRLLEAVMDDKSLEQAVNSATLPGLVGHVIVMPDMHQGYGFPIGGVAATRYPEGVISPGAIGYDINCGVRLLGSQIEYESVREHLDELGFCAEPLLPERGRHQGASARGYQRAGPGLPPGQPLGRVRRATPPRQTSGGPKRTAAWMELTRDK